MASCQGKHQPLIIAGKVGWVGANYWGPDSTLQSEPPPPSHPSSTQLEPRWDELFKCMPNNEIRSHLHVDRILISVILHALSVQVPCHAMCLVLFLLNGMNTGCRSN